MFLDKEVWGWVLIYAIITVSIILIVGLVRLYFRVDYPSITEKLDKDSLNTGDIFAVGYKHAVGWFVTFYSGSYWTHIGVVYRDPQTNEVFILEGANYSELDMYGMIKVPFDNWVNINKRHYISLMRLNGKLDPNVLLDNFDSIKKVDLQGYQPSWIRFLQSRQYQEELQKGYTCYEFITRLLQNCGVVQKKLQASSYFPRDVMAGKYPTVDPYYYSACIGVDLSDFKFNKLIDV